MSSKRERNDRQPERKSTSQGAAKPYHSRPSHASNADARDWLWGWHAVEAALENPLRPAPRRLLVSAERAAKLTGRDGLEVVEVAVIGRLLPQGAVHQGVAMKIDPPEPLSLEEIGSPAAGVILMLDQLTDPQNVGAIFRSAAAFGARAVILQDRHAPPLTGALAKAAAGAVDRIPHALAVNLSRALETLSELGWRAVGLDGEAVHTLDAVLDGGPTVLVMGSEGEGLRRLVAEHCDVLAKINMPGGFESLNVSAAAAVALYEAVKVRGEIRA